MVGFHSVSFTSFVIDFLFPVMGELVRYAILKR